MTDPARALMAAGQRGKAERLLRRRATARDPSAYGLLAELLEEAGRGSEALPWWARQVLEGEPDRLARRRLIEGARALGRADLSRAVLSARQRAHPADADAMWRLGALAREQGELADALALLHRAVAIDAEDGSAHLHLAAALCDAGRPDEADPHARVAAISLPAAPGAQALVAEVARLRGDFDQAREALTAACATWPNRPGLAWARLASLPAISPDAAHEETVRGRYRKELAELEAQAQAGDAAAWGLSAKGAFALHYRGGDWMDEQTMLGALLCRLMAEAFPLPAPAPPPRDKIRVGFVGEAFRRHTITKLFGGWMRGIDRQRFEVFGYALGLVEDDSSRALEASCDGWAALPGPLSQAVGRIVEDAPDVLIFPEVGMDDRVLRLAALRLAPLQAVAWGHPVTTGLPTIDLFLSSAAMKPEPDRRWTTEERVDLPGIGACVARPALAPRLLRGELGLPDAPVLLLCVQSLFKYRPWTDALHVDIARRCPGARLVFIEDGRPAVTHAFQRRLHAAFDAAGLKPEDHLCWLPRLSEADWMGLLRLGDLFLDSPGWSGGNTTLEALSVALPCLAFPGDTMRGRHCLAMMSELDLPELCPPDAAAWVEAAVALALDPAARARLSALIAVRSGRLFEDPRSIRALEAEIAQRVAVLRSR